MLTLAGFVSYANVYRNLKLPDLPLLRSEDSTLPYLTVYLMTLMCLEKEWGRIYLFEYSAKLLTRGKEL